MARQRAAVVATVAAALAGAAAVGWWSWGANAATPIDATIVRAVDGDTVVARLDSGATETVRLLGVDTPETKKPDTPVQCFGPEASAYTARRLTGRRVTLELDAQARDRYGRLLAYVRVDGQLFDDELLELGYARLLVIPPNGSHARAMLAAEQRARDARRGLWGAC